MTTGCNMPSNGGSSPAASGASSTPRSTSWNVAGGNHQKALHRSGPAPGRDRANHQDARRRSCGVKHYVESIPYGRIISTATHFSTDIDYRCVTEDEMAAALSRRDQAGPAERDCYASYVNEAFLDACSRRTASEIVFQFSFGAEPLPFETASRLSQRTIGQIAEIIGRHPKLQFQCFLGPRHANQSMCTLARDCRT